MVDSGSTDGTLAALQSFPNVRVFNRRFDTHGNQWRYATEETKIDSEWLLRLDADYQMSDALVAEIAQLEPNAAVSAYRVAFDYAVFSRKLLSSLYPSKAILLRRGRFSVSDQGHADVWDVHGHVVPLKGRIIHDDRKPVSQWLTGEGAMFATRTRLDSRAQSRIGALVAGQAATDADRRLFYIACLVKG